MIKLRNLIKLVPALALTAATMFGVFGVNKLSAKTPTANVKLIGLAPNNILITLDSRRTIRVTGVEGNLQGLIFVLLTVNSTESGY
jgi:hypothetical protein